jgi:hypothetical protein
MNILCTFAKSSGVSACSSASATFVSSSCAVALLTAMLCQPL